MLSPVLSNPQHSVSTMIKIYLNYSQEKNICDTKDSALRHHNVVLHSQRIDITPQYVFNQVEIDREQDITVGSAEDVKSLFKKVSHFTKFTIADVLRMLHGVELEEGVDTQ